MPLGSKRFQFSAPRAKGLCRHKLRPDLNISEQTLNQKATYVVKVPGENTYFRFGPLEYEILTLCDGTRTPQELALEMIARHPEIFIDEGHVIDFLDSVESSLWERSMRERHIALLDRLREQRNLQLQESSLLNIRFRPWNPDRLLAAIDRYSGWVFTPAFVAASCGLLLATVYLVIANWTTIVADTEALYSLENATFSEFFSFWILLLVLEAVHEFGHGLTCKHFGGQVPEVGFSFVYFTPSLYMDTTDMVLLNRWQRYWVIFAGIWIELLICGLATFLWAFTVPGTFVNGFAYKTLLLSGIETLAWNLNPFIQADGYYVLSEYLGIDNLAENGREFSWAWLQKYVLHRPVDLPQASRRDRRIFLIYTLASYCNAVLLASASLIFVGNIFSAAFGSWGYLLIAALLWWLARNRIHSLWPGVLAVFRIRSLHNMNWKLSREQKSASCAIVLLLLLLPLPFPVTSDFVLEAGNRITLRPKVEGTISDVFVQEGASVRAGQTLALLQNPELDADHQVLANELALTSSDLRTNQFQFDSVPAAQAQRELLRLQAEFAIGRERQSSLEILAPFDGIIVTPALEQRRGQYLASGEEFCRIVDRSNLRARVLVRDWDFPDIKLGATVRLKVPAYPFRTYSAIVDQILPAVAADHPIAENELTKVMGQQLTNYVPLVVIVPNGDGRLREGMTGVAKISGKSRPFAWWIGRAAWRWWKSQVF